MVNIKRVKPNILSNKIEKFGLHSTLKYAGLGFIVASVVVYKSPRAKYLFAIGLLFLAVMFMIKKKHKELFT